MRDIVRLGILRILDLGCLFTNYETCSEGIARFARRLSPVAYEGSKLVVPLLRCPLCDWGGHRDIVLLCAVEALSTACRNWSWRSSCAPGVRMR